MLLYWLWIIKSFAKWCSDYSVISHCMHTYLCSFPFLSANQQFLISLLTMSSSSNLVQYSAQRISTIWIKIHLKRPKTAANWPLLWVADSRWSWPAEALLLHVLADCTLTPIKWPLVARTLRRSQPTWKEKGCWTRCGVERVYHARLVDWPLLSDQQLHVCGNIQTLMDPFYLNSSMQCKGLYPKDSNEYLCTSLRFSVRCRIFDWSSEHCSWLCLCSRVMDEAAISLWSSNWLCMEEHSSW